MKNDSRHVYLDWLRILAIFGVLLYHSARPFIPEDPWHIENVEKSNMLLEFNFFLSRFRMPLLFFISGAVAFFMLQKRSTGQFIQLRVTRLFIPLLAGVLIIVPWQVYMERVANGYKGDFFSFYPSIFTTGPYPDGNFSWHHLWFIAYLLVYDTCFAPLFKWLLQPARQFRVLGWFAASRRIYLLIVIPAVLFAILVIPFPQTNALIDDWCWHVHWIFFLLFGFLSQCVPGIIESLRRNRKLSFQLAFGSILLINFFRWNDIEPFGLIKGENIPAQVYLYLALYSITAWLWVFTAVGYAKQYFNRRVSWQSYVNSAIYPFYILHQTVIVVLAYYVVQTRDTIGMKYTFIVIVSLLLSVAIFHFFIRPFAFTRFLFGMKGNPGKKTSKPASIPATPPLAEMA
jgi:peptidoglycan/LPS O-acetylase OafA/YrhL